MSTDLSKVKRPELQRLAKQHGIKANQKSEKLISALQKIFSVKNEASSPMPSAGVQSLSNTCAGEDNSTVDTSLESETEVSDKSLASEKENSVPTPSSVSLGLIDAVVSEDDAITTLSFLSSGTEVSASYNNKKQRKSKKKSTANKKKSNTTVTPDTDDFKENSMHVTEKSIAKTEESTTQNRDVEMTIESIEPLWDDLEDDEFLDSSVECAAPALTRKTNVPEDQPAQTARKRLPRACKTPEIGDGGNAKTPADTTNIPAESTTPANNSKKQPTDKTFSVPRSRTKARTLPQVDTPKSATKPKATPRSATKPKATPKSATKRKSTISATPIQNKVPRSTEKNWKKNLKQAVERVEQPTLSSVGSKTPLFAATGVTVPGVKSKSTPGIFRKAHEKRFEKLESIDDYQKRKQERADRLLGTGKKRQVLSRLAQPKAAKTTPAKNGRPMPNILTPINKNTLAQARKSSIKPPTVFKPTVTKTNKINTNFSARASKLVTPKKIAVTFAKSPGKAGKGASRTPTATRTPSNTGKRVSRVSLTPFKTIGTPQSAKKKAFDLQESLKKSLPYVPHKGPLTKYQDTAKKSMQERLKNAKNPKGSTREKRRQENVNARRNAKSNMMMKRRGMKMT